jgi:perosamine synthetase
MNEIPEKVLRAIQSVIGSNSASLHEPEFNGNEEKYLHDCLKSSFVSSVGKYVDQFEKSLEDYTNANFAIAVSNGTAALHLSLKLAGVEEGHEVLIPALTFVATANAVTYCHATPHLVDVESLTLGIDPDKLFEYLNSSTKLRDGKCINKSTGKIISALVPMHTFGHPARMDELIEISKDFGLVVVEDAAESLGSLYKKRHTGTIGKIGALSFNGNKIITTGGGGAILTNNEKIAKHAKHLSTTARIGHKWEFKHDEIGFNYRMPNLNAALGCAQLENLQSKLDSKRVLNNKYVQAFAEFNEVAVFRETIDSKSNYWLNALMLDSGSEKYLNAILEVTNSANIFTRPAWTPLNNLKMYKDLPASDLSCTSNLNKRIINIPSSPSLVSRV